jgi:hypothetical protein
MTLYIINQINNSYVYIKCIYEKANQKFPNLIFEL